MATAKDPELPKPQVHVEDMDTEKVEAALDAARRGVLAIMKNEKRQFYEVDARLKKLNSSFDTYPPNLL